MSNKSLRPIEVLVKLWIEEDADPVEVVNEMDYSIYHDDVSASEIIDINTEI
jgi:hypothetical protein